MGNPWLIFPARITQRTLFVVLAVFGAFLYSTFGFAQTSACMVQGQSLDSTKAAYANQCVAPRADCDPFGSVWVCSSKVISSAQMPFGFINQGSAGVETTASPLVSTPVSNSRPESPVLNAVGFPATNSQNGTPVCLVDTNAQHGYSYENGRSCIVVSGITASKSNPLTDSRLCNPWMEIGYGNYVLQNNVWNTSGVYSNNWSQCIELGGSPGNYIARWDYNWLGRTQGEEYAVKSYPQVYYGRKTEFNQSGTVAETGLPARLSQLPEIRVDFKYSETGNAERNVALESFLHTSCEAGENNKFFEMMVWVDKPAIRTAGSLVTTATVDGRAWDVYVNPQLSWGYVAFVAQQPMTEGTLDWNAFVDWSRFQGAAYGVPPTGNDTCLGAVEIGTETFWGNGTFTLERFDVRIKH